MSRRHTHTHTHKRVAMGVEVREDGKGYGHDRLLWSSTVGCFLGGASCYYGLQKDSRAEDGQDIYVVTNCQATASHMFPSASPID